MDKTKISYFMLFVIAVSASILTQSFLTFIFCICVMGAVLLIAKLIKKSKEKKPYKFSEIIDKEKIKKCYPIVLLIMAILSILTSMIWYISLTLSITSLVFSLKRIRATGSSLSKATTSIAIIGIFVCGLVYSIAIMQTLNQHWLY